MRKTRRLLAAMSTAAVLGAFGLTAGAAPADAYRIHEDCGSYFTSYWHWGDVYFREYERAGYETLAAAFAWNRFVHFGHLITANNC